MTKITDTPSWLKRLKRSRKIEDKLPAITWYDEGNYKKYYVFHRCLDYDSDIYDPLCKNHENYICVGEGPVFTNEYRQQKKSYFWFDHTKKKEKILYLQLKKNYPPLLFIPMTAKTDMIEKTIKYYYKAHYDEDSGQMDKIINGLSNDQLLHYSGRMRSFYNDLLHNQKWYYGGLMQSLRTIENSMTLSGLIRRTISSGTSHTFKKEETWFSCFKTCHSMSVIDIINFHTFDIKMGEKNYTPMYLHFRYDEADYINEEYKQQVARINAATEKYFAPDTPMDLIAVMVKYPVVTCDVLKELDKEEPDDDMSFLHVLHLNTLRDPSLGEYLLKHAEMYNPSTVRMIRMVINKAKFPEVYAILDRKALENGETIRKPYDTDDSSDGEDDRPLTARQTTGQTTGQTTSQPTQVNNTPVGTDDASDADNSDGLSDGSNMSYYSDEEPNPYEHYAEMDSIRLLRLSKSKLTEIAEGLGEDVSGLDKVTKKVLVDLIQN
jgi:hypothetical protein